MALRSPLHQLVFTGHLLSGHYNLQLLASCLSKVLHYRRYSAAPAWHTLPLAGCSLSLLLWSAPFHAVPRVPSLNRTQSISFDAGLSLCYSVRGHAIDIIPSVRPLAMSGFPPLILTSSYAISWHCLVCLCTRQ